MTMQCNNPIVSITQTSVTKPGASSDLISNINCTINAGEILSVIGANGAGKSTLLHAVAGDLSLSSGSIEINQQANDHTQRARQLAVLPQLSLLSFPYRVHEVVRLARIPHQTGRKTDEQIINQVLHTMDIQPLKERLYTQLSGGEKQRVQLARVMAQIWREQDANHKTRLLLLDEPTTALDLGHQQQLMQAVQQFASQGVAVMMVLHDINLAARYSDKILALLNSQQIAYGTPTEVVTNKNIHRLFKVETHIAQHPEYDCPVVIGL